MATLQVKTCFPRAPPPVMGSSIHGPLQDHRVDGWDVSTSTSRSVSGGADSKIFSWTISADVPAIPGSKPAWSRVGTVQVVSHVFEITCRTLFSRDTFRSLFSLQSAPTITTP